MVFSGYVPHNGIAGSYGSSIFSFFKILYSLDSAISPVSVEMNILIFSRMLDNIAPDSSLTCACPPEYHLISALSHTLYSLTFGKEIHHKLECNQ